MDEGRGLLAVWNDVDPAHEHEFNTWYQRQHVPQRLGVPGFVDARRYVSIAAAPRYCAFYRLESIDVLTSPAYREILAQPTRWTQRAMPWFRAINRSTCVVTLDRGNGVGGLLGLCVLAASPIAAEALRERIDAAFARIAQDALVVRLQLWENDAAVSGLANPERDLRGGLDQSAGAIVTIEGASQARIEAAREMVAQAAGGIEPVGGVYRLAWYATASDAPAQAGDPPGL